MDVVHEAYFYKLTEVNACSFKYGCPLDVPNCDFEH